MQRALEDDHNADNAPFIHKVGTYVPVASTSSANSSQLHLVKRMPQPANLYIMSQKHTQWVQ
jgi:ribosomal protein S16